jgi:hypothetical protein
VSFDYGGSESVKLHCVTHDRSSAEALYDRLDARIRGQHPVPLVGDRTVFNTLVELLEVDDPFLDEAGVGIYWGKERPDHVRVVRGNNRC